jgi:predicted nucleotidyltransferase
MATQPVDLMFSASRRKLLGTLLLMPDERYHVRELARMTGISAGSIHRELKSMAGAGLLVRTQVGNQVLYQANRSCPIFDELASILRKTTGLPTLIQENLSAISERIDTAVVFGSMANGRQSSDSDVDVLVLGDVKLIDVVSALSSVGQELRREINPVVMTTDDFSALLIKNDRFASRIVEEPKIFVIGDASEFGQPG